MAIDRWLKMLPAAQLETLNDTAHYLQKDHPDRIVAGDSPDIAIQSRSLRVVFLLPQFR
jgi:hypothetical protein